MVLLDATADISGVCALMKGMEAVKDIPQVDYANLQIFHIGLPREYDVKFKDLVKRASTARPYAEWIRQTVLDQTKPGDRVLVVSHKPLFDHKYLEEAPIAGDPADWSGRHVSTLHWGTGIGTNSFRDCDTVFLFGEFWKPRSSTVGHTLGVTSRTASEDTLKGANGRYLVGDYKTFNEGDLLRWTKQLACRGSVRNVDAEGRCGKMRLFTTMDLKRLLRNREALFPGSPKVTLIGQPRFTSEKDTGSRPVDRLADLLKTTDQDKLSSADIERWTGVEGKKLPRALQSSAVKPIAEHFGWSLKAASEVGEGGRRRYLVRG